MREHSTKTTPVFLPADGEASWSLLPSSVSLLSGDTSGDKVSALITATTSVHFPKPVSTDLTIKPDSVLTNPIGKDGCEAGRCKTSTP